MSSMIDRVLASSYAKVAATAAERSGANMAGEGREGAAASVGPEARRRQPSPPCRCAVI